MGHFGGGNSIKIRGDHLPRVPDDEVEGMSKKISQPLKTQKYLDTWAKLIRNRNLLDLLAGCA